MFIIALLPHFNLTLIGSIFSFVLFTGLSIYCISVGFYPFFFNLVAGAVVIVAISRVLGQKVWNKRKAHFIKAIRMFHSMVSSLQQKVQILLEKSIFSQEIINYWERNIKNQKEYNTQFTGLLRLQSVVAYKRENNTQCFHSDIIQSFSKKYDRHISNILASKLISLERIVIFVESIDTNNSKNVKWNKQILKKWNFVVCMGGSKNNGHVTISKLNKQKRSRKIWFLTGKNK